LQYGKENLTIIMDCRFNETQMGKKFCGNCSIAIWERNFGEMIDTDRVGDSNSHLTNSQVSLVKTQYHIHTIAPFDPQIYWPI
jgi:hypothetical protein